MTALTTGALTITVSGQSYFDSGLRMRRCKVALSSGTVTSGRAIPMPTTPASYGLKHRLDRLEIIGQSDSTVDVRLEPDSTYIQLLAFNDRAQTSSGALTASGLSSLATTSNVSGQTFYVGAWGY